MTLPAGRRSASYEPQPIRAPSYDAAGGDRSDPHETESARRRSEVGVRLVVLRLAERLAHDREREAGGVALAGQQPGQAAGGHLVVEAAHRTQLLVDERAGGRALVGLVDLLQRGLGVLVVDALAAQLLRQ